MKNRKRLFKFFKESRQGAVLPLVGLAFGVLVLASGFTIDYARALIVKERLQWALDAAALAGAKVAHKGTAAVKREAEQYFEANFPQGYMGTSGGRLNVSSIDSVSGKGQGFHFDVTGMTMDTYLVGAVGFSNIGVGVESEVNTLPVTPLDVVFSLDLSGSMQVVAGKGCTYLPYANSCYDGTSKLTDAKTAMSDLVETLHPGSGGDMRFGLVGWSSYVNINGAIAGSYTVRTCWDGNKATLVASQNPNNSWQGNASTPPMANALNCREFLPGTIQGAGSMRPMRYLTTNKQTILNAINAQRAEANTDGALGMFWAYGMLERKGLGWVNWKNAARNKSIVLLTDGDNTKYYRDPGEAANSIYGERDNTLQKEWCKEAKDAGINVYTIAYDMDDSIPSRVEGKAMLKTCASDVCPDNTREGGKCYFDARYAADLAAAMKMIGTTMMTMRLTK